MTPDWRELDFDSEFFGCRIARFDAVPGDAAAARALVSRADAAGIDCAYLLLDAADTAALRAAEDAGFRVVDVRLTIACALERADARAPIAGCASVRRAEASDVPALQAIARVSHRDSRFYADPQFPRERCDALYARWIERKCGGAAAAVFTAGERGATCGYLSCDLPEAGVGQLDLLAVAPEARGRGVAAALTAHALAWFRDSGRTRARLVTQGRNANALRHFARFGFAAERVELWLHRWRAGARARS
jgi:dTDP-4-amino-4,6-dideoxy-D-galactose acyltransferase